MNIDAVFNILKRDAEDTDRIISEMRAISVRAYKAEYNELARRAGARTLVMLDDQGFLSMRRTIAREADQVTQTYNNALRRQIEALVTENPAVTLDELGLEINVWNAGHEEWKPAQIALWRDGDARRQAREDFMRLNPDIQGRGRVVPRGKAAEEGCQALIDMGWQKLAIVMGWPLPLHPNCIHSVEIEFYGGEASGNPRMGGVLDRLRGQLGRRLSNV